MSESDSSKKDGEAILKMAEAVIRPVFKKGVQNVDLSYSDSTAELEIILTLKKDVNLEKIQKSLPKRFGSIAFKLQQEPLDLNLVSIIIDTKQPAFKKLLHDYGNAKPIAEAIDLCMRAKGATTMYLEEGATIRVNSQPAPRDTILELESAALGRTFIAGHETRSKERDPAYVHIEDPQSRAVVRHKIQDGELRWLQIDVPSEWEEEYFRTIGDSDDTKEIVCPSPVARQIAQNLQTLSRLKPLRQHEAVHGNMVCNQQAGLLAQVVGNMEYIGMSPMLNPNTENPISVSVTSEEAKQLKTSLHSALCDANIQQGGGIDVVVDVQPVKPVIGLYTSDIAAQARSEHSLTVKLFRLVDEKIEAIEDEQAQELLKAAMGLVRGKDSGHQYKNPVLYQHSSPDRKRH